MRQSSSIWIDVGKKDGGTITPKELFILAIMQATGPTPVIFSHVDVDGRLGAMPFVPSTKPNVRPLRDLSSLGTEEHFRWVEGIVKSLLVLNLLDAVFTLLWVRVGAAEEANALMRELVNNHAVLFVVVKTALVAAGSYLLWRRRHRPVAVIGIFGVFLAYYAVLLYHLQYSSYLVRALMR